MKTSELTGALLDYWTGKADEKPVRMHDEKCVECLPLKGREIAAWRAYAPHADWAQCGPLIEKKEITLFQDWHSSAEPWSAWIGMHWAGGYEMAGAEHEGGGATPQEAICRAVVRAAFGDEVDEVAPCK